MNMELLVVKDAGLLLELDQICISTSLGLFKCIRKSLEFEECIYGAMLISCKFCSNFRKTRDLVNAVYCCKEKTPCEKMKTYLKKKKMMLKSEIKIMIMLKFDLRKFKVNENYSLLFSILFILNAEDNVIRKAFILLNESFLCDSFESDDYPDLVAASVLLAFSQIKNLPLNESLPQNFLSENYFNQIKVQDQANSFFSYLNRSSTLLIN